MPDKSTQSPPPTRIWKSEENKPSTCIQVGKYVIYLNQPESWSVHISTKPSTTGDWLSSVYRKSPTKEVVHYHSR